jgi:hypothetical protein
MSMTKCPIIKRSWAGGGEHKGVAGSSYVSKGYITIDNTVKKTKDKVTGTPVHLEDR